MGIFTAAKIGARAKQARADNHLSQQEMADRLGLSLRGWQKIERGEGTPSGETLLNFEKLGINPGWVLTGLGPKHFAENNEEIAGRAESEHLLQRAVQEMKSVASSAAELVRETFEPPVVPTIKFVPLKVSAGGGAAVLYESQGIDLDMDGLADTILRSRRKNISLFEIKGDSMLPTLAHGDFVVVDKSQPRPGDEPEDDKIYLISIENDLYAKRSRWMGNGEQQWCSDNNLPEYAPIPVRGEDFNRVKVIGRVIWAWKPV
ncbi:LexA family transcriptional regulator [Rhizobium skierniewicense]|uniref:XRE family transcriptional regulator n=1 Tax=Rhizobium skierniewicense TaxID=984260 RepID=UPI001FAE5EE5|nr:LexA family transcriptional regulator [Rhizobium skierniewicense]MCI9864916.1 LexA family transcriptional regulator [Rhizobium skierniewicense]